MVKFLQDNNFSTESGWKNCLKIIEKYTQEKIKCPQPGKIEQYIKFGKSTNDTGSPEIQIAIWTANSRTYRTRKNSQKRQSYKARTGSVSIKKKKMLKYLTKTNPKSYVKLIENYLLEVKK